VSSNFFLHLDVKIHIL